MINKKLSMAALIVAALLSSMPIWGSTTKNGGVIIYPLR